jgi:hypothetical protein
MIASVALVTKLHAMVAEDRGARSPARSPELQPAETSEKTALRRAVLYTLEDNNPSEGVAQRCGFRFDRLVDDTREGRILRLNRWELGDRGTIGVKCTIVGAGATAYCDVANPDRRPPWP